VTCNGEPTRRSQPAKLRDMSVLASRSEWNRGEWEVVEEAGLHVIPMGSVAYKFARVAAGIDNATWTPVPKHEWDVAGGAALLAAGGGKLVSLGGDPIRFNRPSPWISGAIAVPDGFDPHLETVMGLISRQVANE
jgi:myo-inositol-1(or 4)-monophosphatase